MIKNITNIVLVIIILGLIYFNRTQSKEIVRQENAIEAANDTLHTFKTKYNSVGGYISVIEANKGLAIQLLNTERSRNKDLIALLEANKTVQTAAKIGTSTNNYYEVTDTLYKDIDFTKTIKTDWLTEQIDIKKGKFTRSLDYRDEYVFHTDKKDNKGLFTGSTLTAYVTPKNPDTRVTELTSVSTVIDKRKPRLGAYIGGGLSLDKNFNTKPAIQLGVGLTF